MKKSASLPVIAVLALPLLIGCASLVEMGTTAAHQAGMITKQEKDYYDQRAQETESAVRPMNDREEYYVGRAVAATVLGTYRLYQDERLTRYINEVGQALALSSDRPLTYRGYHFAVLDSDEVNALACPGGTILITRGMIKRALNEEELAAILAHEVAHVNHKDGVNAIQRARWVQAVTALGADAAHQLSRGQLDQLASAFEGSVGDVVKTLVVNGYGRSQELAADRSAMIFMARLGYDPNALTDYLGRLAKEQGAGAKGGLFATHPGMADRLAEAQTFVAANKWQRVNHEGRDQRFAAYRR
jgi:predicted Zn-dependent protease